MLNQGLFVVVDGPSGAGKDTLISGLQNDFRGLKHSFRVLTEEALDPDRSAILQAKKSGGDRKMAQLLVKHRAKIYVDHLLPYIRIKEMIICANRGLPATLAYQTAGGELSMDDVWEMHRVAKILKPDLVIMVVCDPYVAWQRTESGKADPSSKRNVLESGKGLSGKVTTSASDDPGDAIRKHERIHAQYMKAADYLWKKRINVVILDSERLSVAAEVRTCREEIMKAQLHKNR